MEADYGRIMTTLKLNPPLKYAPLLVKRRVRKSELQEQTEVHEAVDEVAISYHSLMHHPLFIPTIFRFSVHSNVVSCQPISHHSHLADNEAAK
jgi:hypothetical protein